MTSKRDNSRNRKPVVDILDSIDDNCDTFENGTGRNKQKTKTVVKTVGGFLFADHSKPLKGPDGKLVRLSVMPDKFIAESDDGLEMTYGKLCLQSQGMYNWKVVLSMDKCDVQLRTTADDEKPSDKLDYKTGLPITFSVVDSGWYLTAKGRKRLTELVKKDCPLACLVEAQFPDALKTWEDKTI